MKQEKYSTLWKNSSLPYVYVWSFNSGIGAGFDLSASSGTKSSTNVTVAL